jgi:crotonobetainyl-CoA:carnitine CoA-transferase CaiB-like acyl-CoA transferase
VTQADSMARTGPGYDLMVQAMSGLMSLIREWLLS